MIVVGISKGRWVNLDRMVQAQGGEKGGRKVLYIWYDGAALGSKRDATCYEDDDAERLFAAILYVNKMNWPQPSNLVRLHGRD